MTPEQLTKIEKMVCQEKGILHEMLRAKTRKRDIVEARQIYVYLLLKVFSQTPNDTAKIVGMHRSTGNHCVNTVIRLSDVDKAFTGALTPIIEKAKQLRSEFEGVITIEIPTVNVKPEHTDLISRAVQLIEEMKQALTCEA